MINGFFAHGHVELLAVLPCLLLFGVPRAAQASFSLTFQGYVQTINTGGSITLSAPSGIVVDPTGNIFIADTVGSIGRIVEVNAQGTASVLTINGLTLGSTGGIAIDGSGNFYVVDKGNTRVVKVSSSGAGSVISTGSVTLTAPSGVALDESGDIFISDGTTHVVEVTSGGSAAVLSITVSTSPRALSSPKGLAVDTNGNLYIADSANSRVVKLPAGSTTGTVVSIAGGVTLTSPNDVAVDRIGNLFICDHTDGTRIAEVDTTGNGSVLNANSLTLSSGAAGVAMDVFGTVYIADTGNSRGSIVNPPLDMDPETGIGYTTSLNRSEIGFGHIQLGSSTPVTLTLPFTTGATAGLGGVKVFTSGTQNLDFVRPMRQLVTARPRLAQAAQWQ